MTSDLTAANRERMVRNIERQLRGWTLNWDQKQRLLSAVHIAGITAQPPEAA